MSLQMNVIVVAHRPHFLSLFPLPCSTEDGGLTVYSLSQMGSTLLTAYICVAALLAGEFSIFLSPMLKAIF